MPDNWNVVLVEVGAAGVRAETAAAGCPRGEIGEYVRRTAGRLLFYGDIESRVCEDYFRQSSIEDLQRDNDEIYAELLPGRYEESYADPAWAVHRLGRELGQPLCFLYTRIRGRSAASWEVSKPEQTTRRSSGG